MSQEQPGRGEEGAKTLLTGPITYVDIFNVSGELAAQPVTPQDAALMQSAETRALGHSQKGGVAAVMQAVADLNERAGLIEGNGTDTVVGAQGVDVTEISVPGRKVTTEYIAGQAVQFETQPMPTAYLTVASEDVTIGEALEAAALSAGDKPVEQSDAAAIQSAERRATGTPGALPSGIGAAAQAAAGMNSRLPYEERTTLGDVISAAAMDLPADKAVTMEDARKIQESEARHSASGHGFPGGVGDAMEVAARLNQQEGVM